MSLTNILGVAALHLITAATAISTFSLDRLFVMLILMVLASLGWSVGFHRLNVHRSFKCSRWLRRLLSYLGTLAGIGGPIHMWRSHAFRDYYQSLPVTPDIHGYHSGFFRAYYLILLKLPHPEDAEPVPQDILDDPFFQFLDRTNLLQQIPIMVALYLLGGFPYVIWGVFIRLTVTIDLFASVNYFGHTVGYQSFRIAESAEEGRNNGVLGYLAFGEGWHNNHHAFPGSARIGLARWELDTGYLFILLLKALGLVWDVRTPSSLPPRRQVTPVGAR